MVGTFRLGYPSFYHWAVLRKSQTALVIYLNSNVKTLRVEATDGQRRWQRRSPAMTAGLTDHIWTVKELLTTVVVPNANNTK